MDAEGLGAWGEAKAAGFLRRRGYEIIERNFSCRAGEIDIIARKKDFIVFVEVKTRKSDDYVSAREYVTRQKQRRILDTAALWLSRRDGEELQPRFDVIEVYAPKGKNSLLPRIEHIEDAFC